MTSELSFDTIVAPATPPGRGALAIIRVDGPESASILASLSGREITDFPERHATLVRLRHEDGDIDEAVAIRYEGPRSFTGNDLVELTLHGSPYVVSQVIRAAIAHGARIAEPGEFTERAVLNGKLDLVQAESVAELIASRTALQARLSLAHLEGDLSRAAGEIRGELLFVISRLEAALDFSEEGYEFVSREEAVSRLESARSRVREIRATYDRGHATATGLTAVILGRPNSGKSTLLNFLCGSDRAIVTEIPGTTRDLLRETVDIGGLPVTLVDTAGLRATEETVEAIGIRRAREEAARADLVLYLLDSAAGETDEDRLELEQRPDAFVVYTKADLGSVPPGSLGISVPARIGLDELLRRLDETVLDRFAPPEGTPTIVNERQRGSLAECEEALGAAIAALREGAQDEIVLVDLTRAANALGTLVGEISREDVYTEIFSKFCIGK